MACFIVPATEAIVTTALTKVVQKKEARKEHEAISESGIDTQELSVRSRFSDKMKWLNNMLWGGSGLLAFEHVWHGEVTPFFPFLTNAANPEDARMMLQEMATSGVGMALLVTFVWAGMVYVAGKIDKDKIGEDVAYTDGIIATEKERI